VLWLEAVALEVDRPPAGFDRLVVGRREERRMRASAVRRV
jgi:hypothetical protein